MIFSPFRISGRKGPARSVKTWLARCCASQFRLQFHALEFLQRGANRLYVPFACPLIALDLFERVREVVEAANGLTIGAFDGLDLLQRFFERGLVVGSSMIAVAVAVGVLWHGLFLLVLLFRRLWRRFGLSCRRRF